MKNKNKKEQLRKKRHQRIRLKLNGTSDVPRLIVRRSLNNLYAQVIDDTRQKVLFSMSTMDKGIRDKFSSAGNIKAAELFGSMFSKMVKEKGINKIVFDRAGYLYHGRVKAFAESLRKGGLGF